MDSNNVKIKTAPESSYGQIDGTTFDEVPVNSVSISDNKTAIDSDLIRADRQVADNREVAFDPAGDIELDLHDKVPDYVIESMMRNEFVANTVNDANKDGVYGLVASTDTITFADPADYNKLKGAGIIKITGSATPANNGFKIVKSVDDTNRVITLNEGSITADDDVATTEGLVLACKYIVNGTKYSSFAVEEEYIGEDGDIFILTNGLAVNTASITLDNRSKATLSLNLMGKQWIPSAATVATAVNASDDTYMLNTSSDLSLDADFYPGITELSLEINNNQRVRPELGSLYSARHGSGTCNVTGSVNAYFDKDVSKMLAVINHSDVSISVGGDNKLFGFRLTIPRAKLTKDSKDVTGKDTDVMVSFTLNALKAIGAGGYTLRLDYIS